MTNQYEPADHGNNNDNNDNDNSEMRPTILVA
eukprot:CAMPEP_0185748096 /NCGR_PEP_ID=MMETSP1174-20130828/6758_1 /TAXON_ID=35687 /ORGANISM="Dictyocha speculum, Strain CCMP1381" /LENGTH=31 /DNA_ID= /DNA_START= /DNA_END= /DNA_ORIENTATION=